MNVNDLESQIAAWRARMSAALPGQEETVRELEAHLRDHIEAKTRAGAMTPEAAFDEGVKRVGEPRAVAREFARVEGEGGLAGPLVWFAVRPMVVIYGLVGTGFAAIFAMMMWNYFARHMSLLLAAHVIALSAGYLSMVAAGFVGMWTMGSGWRRPSTNREIQTQRREIFRMTVAGSVLVPVGLVLGAVWASNNPPYHQAWSWAPIEVGALSVLVSTWLLLLMQWNKVVVNHRMHGVLALMGASVVGLGWFAKGLTSIVPIGWLYIAVILGQGAIALLQVRSKRAGERAHLASE